MWIQLSRADIERVKQELQTRRSEMLARHAGELTALDAMKLNSRSLSRQLTSLFASLASEAPKS